MDSIDAVRDTGGRRGVLVPASGSPECTRTSRIAHSVLRGPIARMLSQTVFRDPDTPFWGC